MRSTVYYIARGNRLEHNTPYTLQFDWKEAKAKIAAEICRDLMSVSRIGRVSSISVQ